MVLLKRPLNEVLLLPGIPRPTVQYDKKVQNPPPPLNLKMPILGVFKELQKLQIMFLKLLWM